MLFYTVSSRWGVQPTAQSLEASPTTLQSWKLHLLSCKAGSFIHYPAKLGSFTHYCHAWKRDLLTRGVEQPLNLVREALVNLNDEDIATYSTPVQRTVGSLCTFTSFILKFTRFLLTSNAYRRALFSVRGCPLSRTRVQSYYKKIKPQRIFAVLFCFD